MTSWWTSLRTQLASATLAHWKHHFLTLPPVGPVAGTTPTTPLLSFISSQTPHTIPRLPMAVKHPLPRTASNKIFGCSESLRGIVVTVTRFSRPWSARRAWCQPGGGRRMDSLQLPKSSHLAAATRRCRRILRSSVPKLAGPRPLFSTLMEGERGVLPP